MITVAELEVSLSNTLEILADALLALRSIEASFGTLDHSPAIDSEKLLPNAMASQAAYLVGQLSDATALAEKQAQEIATLKSFQINFEHATKLERAEQAQEIADLKMQYRISQEVGAASEQRAMRFEYERDQHAEKVRQMRSVIEDLRVEQSIGPLFTAGVMEARNLILRNLDSHFPPTAEPSGDSQADPEACGGLCLECMNIGQHEATCSKFAVGGSKEQSK